MIAKLKYSWVEGEQDECYIIHPKKNMVQFEDDLREIKDIIDNNKFHDNHGESEFIPCPPSYYELVLTYLKEYGYIEESSYKPTEYDISDTWDKRDIVQIQRKVVDYYWEDI